MYTFDTQKSDDLTLTYLLPRLFDGLLGGKEFHNVGCTGQEDQYHRDQKVVEIFLEKIERLRGCYASDEDIQAVHEYQTGTFQPGRGSMHSLDVCNRLVVVDDDFMRHWQLGHVWNDTFLPGLFRRRYRSPRIQQRPGHFNNGPCGEGNCNWKGTILSCSLRS